jgi:hypothetical protein
MLQVSTSLRFGRGKKLGGVSRWFLQGVLRILVCFVVVNRGEVVVDSWLIVVNCVVIFGVGKHATFSGFIFDARVMPST